MGSDRQLRLYDVRTDSTDSGTDDDPGGMANGGIGARTPIALDSTDHDRRAGGDADRGSASDCAPHRGRGLDLDGDLDSDLDGDPDPRHERWSALCEMYRDDPDDIFSGDVRTERRRMDLDERVDRGLTARHFLNRFDPARANRPDPDGMGATDVVAEQIRAQPRLASLARQERCVQRVYATFGNCSFHGAERHEGSLDDQDHLLRLVERQDPAQTDDARRTRGIDAFKKGNGKHVCAESSTSIADSVAYAVALARGVDHPAVRAALDAQHDPPRRPHYVQVPIVELLGESGHEFCGGHRLVGDDPREAIKQRDVWAKAGWKGKRRDDLSAPQTESIMTFKDGVMEFRIGHNAAMGRYELISMFPRPRKDPIEGSEKE